MYAAISRLRSVDNRKASDTMEQLSLGPRQFCCPGSTFESCDEKRRSLDIKQGYVKQRLIIYIFSMERKRYRHIVCATRCIYLRECPLLHSVADKLFAGSLKARSVKPKPKLVGGLLQHGNFRLTQPPPSRAGAHIV